MKISTRELTQIPLTGRELQGSSKVVANFHKMQIFMEINVEPIVTLTNNMYR